MAYELVQTIEVGSGGAASIEFTGIAATGKDLLVVLSGRLSTTNGNVNLTVNNSGTGYASRYLRGNGSTIASASATAQSIFYVEQALPGTGETANTFSNVAFYLPNYAGSNTKSLSVNTVTENNATEAYQVLQAGSWSGTSAITSIKLAAPSGTLVQYSSASLYIISDTGASGATGSAAIAKATGGTITYSGGYFIHTFTSSGSFVPTENISNADFLVIAGGGTGSMNGGGGGGAGGYRCSVTGESSGGGASAESKINFTTGNSYTVTVGAGGAGFDANQTRNSGNNSSLTHAGGTITSTGGGGGGYDSTTVGPLTGGSGGGAGYGDRPGAAGTANQGYAGGSNSSGFNSASGGGGAGGVGQNCQASSKGGDGGAGVTSSITGTAVARAGGGGGSGDSTQGTGQAGGSNGADGGASGNATANSGSGSGGQWLNASLSSGVGSGGSGIVIVRYAA